ncbi:hypothetical protein D3C85_1227300 [compost metagenome]
MKLLPPPLLVRPESKLGLDERFEVDGRFTFEDRSEVPADGRFTFEDLSEVPADGRFTFDERSEVPAEGRLALEPRSDVPAVGRLLVFARLPLPVPYFPFARLLLTVLDRFLSLL